MNAVRKIQARVAPHSYRRWWAREFLKKIEQRDHERDALVMQVYYPKSGS